MKISFEFYRLPIFLTKTDIGFLFPGIFGILFTRINRNQKKGIFTRYLHIDILGCNWYISWSPSKGLKQ